jgi:hypothetical protein
MRMQHPTGYEHFLIAGPPSFLGCEYGEQWLSALLSSTPFRGVNVDADALCASWPARFFVFVRLIPCSQLQIGFL